MSQVSAPPKSTFRTVTASTAFSSPTGPIPLTTASTTLRTMLPLSLPTYPSSAASSPAGCLIFEPRLPQWNESFVAIGSGAHPEIPLNSLESLDDTESHRRSCLALTTTSRHRSRGHTMSVTQKSLPASSLPTTAKTAPTSPKPANRGVTAWTGAMRRPTAARRATC